MNKQDLIQKLKQLDGLTADEKAALIELVKTKKKYGLVWEDKPEAVEEQLRQYLPVLKEVKDKRILAKDLPLAASNELFEKENQDFNKPAPNHILIEGDNLHALTALTFTHEGKIDVIYIDPPYNTGNKDFKYNDSFVDKEDSYRHSKWLSFMAKRLKIAKTLLNEKGVIFISIDDNEHAQLKLLCDEIFGEINFVANVVWRSADSSNNDSKQFSLDHNDTYVYSKTAPWFPNLVDRQEENNEHYKNPDNDPNGPWFSGNVSSPNPRKNLQYYVTAPNGNQIAFPKNGWRWSEVKMNEFIDTGEVVFSEDNTRVIKKTYLKNQKGLAPSTLWIDIEDTGHNRNAKYELIKLFPNKDTSELFSTPKPTKFIAKILKLSTKKEKPALILDFFAGSGTTLHAVMQLNSLDGGHRECILVTNNENNICEQVTYERNKRVILGYDNTNGTKIAGLTGNNLRYYKCEFVSSIKTEINKRELTKVSTELLKIKENCYHDITEASGFNSLHCAMFTDGTGKHMIVVYHSRNQNAVCEQLIEYIKPLLLEGRIKLYAFSPEKETLAADFAEVADKIDALPLPEAIYNAYRATFRTLRLDRRIINPAEVIETETAPELFDTTTGA